MPPLLRSLSCPPFAWLWTGQTISRLGDTLYRIALSWWVLEKTGSAAVMGTVLIFSFTPMLLFLLIGGVAVDRFPRLKVMLLSDLLRGVIVLVVTALAFTRRLEIWHVYTASILFGLVDAFFQPAYTAVVPEITPPEVLTSANSLSGLSAQFANIAGPSIGALLVNLGGTSLGFALDGLSFFISAACLLPVLKQSLPQRAPAPSQGIHLELKAGLKTVINSPWLWITISIAALSNVTLSGPTSVSLPFLVKDNLHLDVDALGLIYSFSAVGSVLGAVVLGFFPRLHRRGLLAYGGWILSGLTLIIYGLPLPLGAMLAASLVNGAMLSVLGLVWTNTLQEMVPPELLGRVASIDMLGSYVLLPVGYGLAGLMTDQFGAPLVFIGGGICTALITAAGLLHPAIRNLE
jgi:DHA3 family tetracycline resistance protein-like MFS transporter